MREIDQLGASFRDPSGFLFVRGGVLFRQVNQRYAGDYSRLMQSGLYERLVKSGLLIPHMETDEPMAAEDRGGFKVIRPERVPFISYPYEWCFSQLKDAALATLSIQKRALKAGMSLKDASAYNIQFVRGRPVLIDTLSFETYREGKPWDAYRQFCQHFLAPLALMSQVDVRLVQLLRVHIDGIPLDLASHLLPLRTRLDFGLLTHIHLHARAQAHYAGVEVQNSARGSVSRNAFLGLIESLVTTVKKLTWKPAGTEWGNYYDITNYSDSAFQQKKHILSRWVGALKPGLVWDLGANNGVFSRIASEAGAGYIISSDVDPAAVEQNYLQVKAAKEESLLPLLLDLTNPSPAQGWDNREREAFGERGPAGLALALALVHHMAISNNVPLRHLADFLARNAKHLVIEFVPKQDSQVQKLLASRADIFPDYTLAGFEAAFSSCFKVLEKIPLAESDRVLYLMEIS
jgi:ribosomal protein L11 methylase PrmA